MKLFIISCALVFLMANAFAQDNYEIQVYGSETVEPHTTMVDSSWTATRY